MGSDTKRKFPILHIPDKIAYASTQYASVDPHFEMFREHHKNDAWGHLAPLDLITSSLEQFYLAFPGLPLEVEFADMANPYYSDQPGIIANVFANPARGEAQRRFLTFMRSSVFEQNLSHRSNPAFRRSPLETHLTERYRFQFPITQPNVVSVIANHYKSLLAGDACSPKNNVPPEMRRNTAFEEFLDILIHAIRYAREQWIYESYAKT